jgi:predicted ester cyclase
VVREQTKQDRRINKTGQLEFNFAQTDIKKDGDKVELQKVENYWMNKLSYTQVQFGIEEFADMLEETRWYIIDFQKAFNGLLSEGKVKNLSSTRKRPVHAIHFKANYGKGEFLIKVKK